MVGASGWTCYWLSFVACAGVVVALVGDFLFISASVDVVEGGSWVGVCVRVCLDWDVEGALAAAQRDMRDAGVRLEADYG